MIIILLALLSSTYERRRETTKKQDDDNHVVSEIATQLYFQKILNFFNSKLLFFIHAEINLIF